MMQELIAKLESWLQRSPQAVLSNEPESYLAEDAVTHELRAALKPYVEARAAFADARAKFITAGSARKAAMEAKPIDVQSAKKSMHAMVVSGHQALGHYLAAVEAALAVVPLAASAERAVRDRASRELEQLKASLLDALHGLGFADFGGVSYYAQQHTRVSLRDVIAGHPKVIGLFTSVVAGTQFSVTPEAEGAAREAADLIVEIELGQD